MTILKRKRNIAKMEFYHNAIKLRITNKEKYYLRRNYQNEEVWVLCQIVLVDKKFDK